MLLKDCPVGSVVRLVSICGKDVWLDNWTGEFVVQCDESGIFVVDGRHNNRRDVTNDSRYQFEIVRPEATPEPRITFTVGGREFYVGQRVWSLVATQDFYTVLNGGDELEIRAHILRDDMILCSKSGEARGIFFEATQISTTPPAPHEWKRGDWARHKDGRTAFVCGAAKLHGEFGPTSLMVSFKNEAITNIPASEFTFISHSEPPE